MDAEFIITNSFHDVAFSINFSKNFITFVEGALSSSRNSRFYNICSKVGFLNHVINVDSNLEFDNLEKTLDIDYEQANQKLDGYKNLSMQYLMNSLSH